VKVNDEVVWLESYRTPDSGISLYGDESIPEGTSGKRIVVPVRYNPVESINAITHVFDIAFGATVGQRSIDDGCKAGWAASGITVTYMV
jgi:hypothetical protein